MITINCADYREMSEMACNAIIEDIVLFPGQLMASATGNSVLGLYNGLASKYKTAPGLFANLGILKLDEWLGLFPDDPSSCESFLQVNLNRPLGITGERYIGFHTNPEEPERECERVEDSIKAWGGIGCCILGLGVNGHIGFNEPADYLLPHCHVSRLSGSSRNHSMMALSEVKPEFGLTLGMNALLQARKIILLLTGPGKTAAIQSLFEKRITTLLPASLLWTHPDVICYRDMKSTG